MAEEKKLEEEKEEESTEEEKTEPVEDISSTEAIDKANLVLLRKEEANKKEEELLDRRERLLVQEKLGGKSEAGIIKEKPKEESDKEYAERILKSGIA